MLDSLQARFSQIGKVLAIYVCPAAGDPMESKNEVKAVIGGGLLGDRYCAGIGSWNKSKPGHRQVTLINNRFVANSSFEPEKTRRNILTEGIELMMLIGRYFEIGTAFLKGVKYCDPCGRPGKLVQSDTNFSEEFADAGGLIAEVIESGIIKVDDPITLSASAHQL